MVGSSATPDDLLTSYIGLICGAYQHCCEESGLKNTPCEAFLRKVTKPPIEPYDPALGASCLEGMLVRVQQPEFCRVDLSSVQWGAGAMEFFDTTCFRAFGYPALNPVPRQEAGLGQPCGGDMFYGSSSNAKDSMPGLCDVGKGLWCNPATAVCEATSAAGPCDPKSLWGCNAESYCKDGACVPRKALGEPCADVAPRECVPEAYCSLGKCVRRLTGGVLCQQQPGSPHSIHNGACLLSCECEVSSEPPYFNTDCGDQRCRSPFCE